MGMIIAPRFILSQPVQIEQPPNHARIGFRTIWRRDGATVSASSAQEGFPASAAANELTYEFWRPTALPAQWSVDAGRDVAVDYCGIASHTLRGLSIQVQYLGAEGWTTVGERTPADNRPIMILFDRVEAQEWRINIIGSGSAPSVGTVFFGQALQMQRGLYGGHSPITLSRQTTREPNRSERGQWVGMSLVRGGTRADFSWRHLTADWYRQNFDPFVEYATQSSGTFFIAWRPQQFPQEVGYCWVDQDDIQPSNMGIRDLMQVDMSVVGQVDFETPDVSRFA